MGFLIMERRGERAAYRGLYKRNISSKLLTGKKRWAYFHEFLQPVELKYEF